MLCASRKRDSFVCSTGFSRNFHGTISAKAGTTNIRCINSQPLRNSQYEPSSIPWLKPRAIKCRRSATKSRKTHVYASQEFLK